MINGQIRAKEVRLIGKDGNQIGIVSISEAMRMANDANLDLVAISPNAKPIVCKIIDYGKYKFELAKKNKEAKKKQKTITLKEIRMSPSIEKHDVQIKVKQAIKFLNKGDKVKVSIFFKGREMVHKNIGKKILDIFVEDLAEYAVIDKNATVEGRYLSIFLSPKK